MILVKCLKLLKPITLRESKETQYVCKQGSGLVASMRQAFFANHEYCAYISYLTGSSTQVSSLCPYQCGTLITDMCIITTWIYIACWPSYESIIDANIRPHKNDTNQRVLYPICGYFDKSGTKLVSFHRFKHNPSWATTNSFKRSLQGHSCPRSLVCACLGYICFRANHFLPSCFSLVDLWPWIMDNYKFYIMSFAPHYYRLPCPSAFGCGGITLAYKGGGLLTHMKDIL